MAYWRRATLPIIGSLLMLGGSQAAPLSLVDAGDRLVLLNSNHWKNGEWEGRKCLILDTPGEQRPPVRRPSEFALFKSETPIGAFSVEAATLAPVSTIHRDICLIFGYLDDTHFYYAHVSSNSDNKVHNVIMRVDGDRRTRINIEQSPEPRLANGWRLLKIKQGKNGEICVFVDDMKKPLMTAVDKTYPIGKIGFGSFDDRAAFATLIVD